MPIFGLQVDKQGRDTEPKAEVVQKLEYKVSDETPQLNEETGTERQEPGDLGRKSKVGQTVEEQWKNS